MSKYHVSVIIDGYSRNKFIVTGERHLIDLGSFYWLKLTRISLIKWQMKILFSKGRRKICFIIPTVSHWHIAVASQEYKIRHRNCQNN